MSIRHDETPAIPKRPNRIPRWLFHPGWLLAQRSAAVLMLVLWSLAQLPFAYLLWQHHDKRDFDETMWTIVSHAPNQFLFLPLILPFGLYAIWKLWGVLFELESRHPSDFASSRTWAAIPLLVILGGFPLATLIGWDESGALGGNCSHDWYQQASWSDVTEAANSSRTIGEKRCFAEIDGEQRASCEECKGLLGDSPGAPGTLLKKFHEAAPDWTLIRLEAVELGAVLFAILLAFLGAGVSMSLKLSTRLDPVTKKGGFRCSKALREEVAQTAKPTMLACLSFAMFIPMRTHNLAEMRSIVRVETIHPFVMMFAVIVLLALGAIARFGAADTVAKRIVQSLVGGAATAACLLFTVAPTLVAGFMRDLNTQMIGCLVFVFAFFFWLVQTLMSAPD